MALLEWRMAHRLRKRVLDGPTAIQPHQERVRVNSYSGGPLGDGQSHLIVRQQAAAPGIASLLGGGSPTAIGWFVIAIVVDSFNRVRWAWFWSHVGDEALKRRDPALANLDAASAVAFEAANVRIQAPVFHVLPASPLSCVAPAVTERMGLRGIYVKATATLGFSGAEVSRADNSLAPAITLASPRRTVAALSAYYRKPAEPLTRKFDGFRHHALSSRAIIRSMARSIISRSMRPSLSAFFASARETWLGFLGFSKANTTATADSFGRRATLWASLGNLLTQVTGLGLPSRCCAAVARLYVFRLQPLINRTPDLFAFGNAVAFLDALQRLGVRIIHPERVTLHGHKGIYVYARCQGGAV